MSQATPESLAVLKRVDTVGFSKKVRDSLNALLTHPDLIEPRSNPELTREDFLRVFQGAKNMDLSKERQLEDVVNRDEREIARLHDKSEEEFSRALEKKMKDEQDLEVARKPWSDFIDQFWSGKPTERDAVSVLKSEDLPLLRYLRRLIIVPCNQHALKRYNDLTSLLMTMVWKPELVH